MADLPMGTITFLFTDIEGSTRIAQAHPDAMKDALCRHHAILQHAIESHNGYVFQIIGDAFCAAFATAPDALKAALDAQRALHTEPWSETGPVRVRMGLHAGIAQVHPDDVKAGQYSGYIAMARTQRIMSAGHGEQVLLTQAVYELVRDHLPEDVTLRDVGEHRLKDLAWPEHIYQLAVPDLPFEFPVLKTLDRVPNNLPIQLTSFVGRENEMTEVKRLLSATRLLTLTGSGGAGKSRLSLQVVADVLDNYKDGAWFIELAPLTDPALIPQTIASELGLREEQGRPLIAVLSDYLHAKTALIILDNCEHLIAGCAQFADTILRAAPHVKIVTSSREALGIGGEVTYRVPSLAVPDPQHTPPIVSLTQFDAVKLFIERAMAVLPSFQVNNANAPAVAQICYHLDGIPLAIELGAARVRGMRVEQIAQRLDDRFRLLTGGSRTELPRHQTLRAMIDWSHSLLSDHERVLFRRLSVFAGGWSIEAAETVCAGDEIESSEILDLLLHLVDKSLVIMNEQSDETRYRMLETIREYAHGRLLESGEESQIRVHHLAFFLQFAAKDEPEPLAVELRQWLERLEIDLDNLRTALDWSLRNDIESGLRLVGVVGRFCWGTLHETEGLDWLRKFLALPEISARTPERAKALLWAGVILREESWVDQADIQSLMRQSRVWLEESLAIYQELGAQSEVADSLYQLGIDNMQFPVNLEAAREFIADSVRISQEAGDKIRAARALGVLSSVYADFGDRTQARRLCEEALHIYREAGRRFAASFPLGNLGAIALFEGDLTAARSYSEESLALFREADMERMATWVLLNLGEIAARQGRFDEAHAYIERSMTLSQEGGVGLGSAVLVLAFVAYSQGDYSQADELYRKGLVLVKGRKFFITFALEGLGSVVAMQSKAKRAITLFGAAAAVREAIGMPAPPIYQTDNERGIATARAQLDEGIFNAVWAAGQKMSMDEAIQYALNEV